MIFFGPLLFANLDLELELSLANCGYQLLRQYIIDQEPGSKEPLAQTGIL